MQAAAIGNPRTHIMIYAFTYQRYLPSIPVNLQSITDIEISNQY